MPATEPHMRIPQAATSQEGAVLIPILQMRKQSPEEASRSLSSTQQGSGRTRIQTWILSLQSLHSKLLHPRL